MVQTTEILRFEKCDQFVSKNKTKKEILKLRSFAHEVKNEDLVIRERKLAYSFPLKMKPINHKNR